MKFNLKAFCKKIKEEYYHARALKRMAVLEQQSRVNLNVMEFDGGLYLSYYGVPIVKADNLKQPLTEILEETRKQYLKWKTEFDS